MIAHGTWTPGLSFSGGNAGLGLMVQNGWYYRIDELVIAAGNITLSAIGGAAGVASITGLPFSAARDAYSSSIRWGAMASNFVLMEMGIPTGASRTADLFGITGPAASSTVRLQAADFSNNSLLSFSFFYLSSGHARRRPAARKKK